MKTEVRSDAEDANVVWMASMNENVRAWLAK